MLICEVIGHVWATKKEPTLSGLKMMVVRELTPDYAPRGNRAWRKKNSASYRNLSPASK